MGRSTDILMHAAILHGAPEAIAEQKKNLKEIRYDILLREDYRVFAGTDEKTHKQEPIDMFEGFYKKIYEILDNQPNNEDAMVYLTFTVQQQGYFFMTKEYSHALESVFRDWLHEHRKTLREIPMAYAIFKVNVSPRDNETKKNLDEFVDFFSKQQVTFEYGDETDVQKIYKSWRDDNIPDI